MALEWAKNIKQQPDLDDALDINEVNIMELLDEIRQLKKDLRNLQRDNDVLYFELNNWKPEEPDKKRGKCPLDID
jgi:regulator of replication initiation timing